MRGTRRLKLQFCVLDENADRTNECQFCFRDQNTFRAKSPAVTVDKQFCLICNIADNDVCFCRVMNQLADVDIQSSVGMFTMSCQSLTSAASLLS